MKDTKSQRKLKSPTLQENEDKKSNSMTRISPVIANATSPTPSEKSKTSNMSGIISSYFAHKADAKSAQKQIQGGAKSKKLSTITRILTTKRKARQSSQSHPNLQIATKQKLLPCPNVCKMKFAKCSSESIN